MLELCGACIRNGKRTDKFNGFPRPNNQFTLHASERATQGKYEKDHSAGRPGPLSVRPPVTTLGCEMLSPLRSLFPIRLHREICALHPRKEGCVKILLLGLGNRDANHLYRISSSSNRRHLSFYVGTLGDIHPTVVTVCS